MDGFGSELVWAGVLGVVSAGLILLITRLRTGRGEKPAHYHWRGILGLSTIIGLLAGFIVHFYSLDTADIPEGVAEFELKGPPGSP